MSTQTITAENLLLPDGWHQNQRISVTDGRISDITDICGRETKKDCAYAVPALIDNHIHGGFGFDVTEITVDGLIEFLQKLGEKGIGGILLCPYGSFSSIHSALEVCREVISMQNGRKTHGAKLLGVHPEGPFLNPARPGAMLPETIRKPSPEAFDAYFAGYTDLIPEITLAPEEDDGFATVTYLRKQGIRVLAGHTDCDYETALASFSAGIGATCHTFNAMRPLKHRDPGLVTAALTNRSVFSEFIGDTVHLHPGVLRLLFRCKGADRLLLVSDAVKTTGLPDGVYVLPHETVYVKNGENRLEDGTLDGGSFMISDSVKKLVRVGIDPRDALVSASSSPAEWLGIAKQWSISVGNEARIACFDEEMNLSRSLLRC